MPTRIRTRRRRAAIAADRFDLFDLFLLQAGRRLEVESVATAAGAGSLEEFCAAWWPAIRAEVIARDPGSSFARMDRLAAEVLKPQPAPDPARRGLRAIREA